MYFAELIALLFTIFLVGASAKLAMTRYQKAHLNWGNDQTDRTCQEWRAFLRNIEALQNPEVDPHSTSRSNRNGESDDLEEIIDFSSQRVDETCIFQDSHYKIILQNRQSKERSYKLNNYWIRRLRKGEK